MAAAPTVEVSGPGLARTVPGVGVGVSLALTYACRRNVPAGTTFYVRVDGVVRRQVIAGVDGAVAVVVLIEGPAA